MAEIRIFVATFVAAFVGLVVSDEGCDKVFDQGRDE
jgi:hypothetical protein